MKKVINIILVCTVFFAIAACGGKEMNGPADGSSCGPNYRHDNEPLAARDCDTTCTSHHK